MLSIFIKNPLIHLSGTALKKKVFLKIKFLETGLSDISGYVLSHCVLNHGIMEIIYTDFI